LDVKLATKISMSDIELIRVGREVGYGAQDFPVRGIRWEGRWISV
jgi:hypothetical protein